MSESESASFQEREEVLVGGAAEVAPKRVGKEMVADVKATI